ncbi:hypothetical protein SAMN05421640_2146 [Ekhidna lutea]|uniref:Lipoprotein n=1 Tax=Ekhidna lutea TaxID=447679 RepID=A0A239JG64_EKHLU|nr:hypothetical protein [Ekhidna lutea]SNT04592.1 hypothetical protein SAMN05421640_2146 [Ekhidna lutea]
MNNLSRFAKKTTVVLFVFLFSCANITEEIYLNKDGSGRYVVYTDAVSSTRAMMMGMMTSIYPDASKDSIMQVVDAQLWEQFPAEVDSIIDFSSRVPDSIKNDPAKKKYLDNIEMFMKGSREKGYLNSGIRYTFSSIDELQGFNDFMSENQEATGGQMNMDLPQMDVQYSFDGSSFSRTAKMNENIEMNDSTMMMLGSLLEGAKSRLIIHLPSKAKKVSKNQLVGKVGKDVTYEFELIKILSGEQSTDVKVEF